MNDHAVGVITGFKPCRACKVWYAVTEFRRKSNPNKCMSCLNAYNRAYQKKHPEKPKGRLRDLRGTIKGRAALMYSQIKARSKKRNVEFSVSREFLEQKLENGVCEATGLPFNFDIKVFWENPFGPSVDRIESGENYTHENIQLACNMYNLGKSKYNELDFIAMCCAVAERHRDDPAVIARLAALRNGEF